MKVLVTGGAGYIGSHACKALAEAGHEPVAFDNLRTGHRWAVQWGPLVEGDIEDTGAVASALRTHGIEAVMHFAALAYVGESVQQPNMYYRTNVGGLASVLDAMTQCDIGRIIFSSTCAVYGVPERLPITEDMPCAPINPYGHTKLMCEQMLIDHAEAHGIGATALRYFNAAGADASGVIGESHDPETHLIPLVLDAALGTRDAITVLGDDYDTPDGTCIRDYIHVTDLAVAHVSALDRLEPGRFERFNLGTGSGISVLEIIEAVRAVTGREVPVTIGARRPGDPPVLVADAAKARASLGFDPRHSDVENLIATAWNWLTRDTGGISR